MSTSAIIFYAISALILGGGILAVTSRQIFRSAIWLLSSLVGIAALYFWMAVEFIAAVQIIVYVGGIAVLVAIGIAAGVVVMQRQAGAKSPEQAAAQGPKGAASAGSIGRIAVAVRIDGALPGGEDLGPVADAVGTASQGRHAC
mgnify:CR=1 FL=1